MIDELKKCLDYERNHMVAMYRRISNRISDIEKTESCYDDTIIANRNSNGTIQYYYYESGYKNNRRYINKSECNNRKVIQEYFYLKKAQKICENNIALLQDMESKYETIDPAEVVKNAPLAYREQEKANMLLYGYEGSSRWKERKLKEKSKYPTYKSEFLRHTAGDGTITRSKSEAMIINLLNEKKIPYVYDFPMIINNKLKLPDFLILDKKSNRELIIEHLGIMVDETYRREQIEKIGDYIEAGYTPNINLLLTFDDKNGNINIPAISKMIDAFIGN